MNLKTIDGHTFDFDLIKDGWIIDAGCRGFKLSTELEHKKTFAIDIEHFTYDIPKWTTFRQAALTNKSGKTFAYYFGNGTGNFINGVNEEPGNTEDRPVDRKWIDSITLEDIYKETGEDIGLLKLDIEGAEYEVLEGMLRPVPRQITVEMHEHCHTALHDKYIGRVIAHLAQWYDMQLFPDTQWPRYKYMDCLFTRKEL
jgi:FkbM family methyltransferase